MKQAILSILLLFPVFTFAQGLQTYIPSILVFINTSLIPFLLGIAFLVVVFNTVRYFVAGSTSEEGREKAKGFITYSIFAFVFIIIFWGIINLLVNLTGLGGTVTPQTTDFETQFTTP